jgi:DNA (cytosine-5)-methyltransferase 1
MSSTAPRTAPQPHVPPKFLAVDFFCGAGGTTRGLIDAGGYVIAGIDKDNRCERTYTENNLNEAIDFCAPRFLHRDIFPRKSDYPQGEQRQLFADLDSLIPYYRRKARKVPLLFAICAPCQPFTRLSHERMMSEERLDVRARDANLLREACRFVYRYQPEMVLSENVAGIRGPKYGGVWERFRRRLEQLGYVTGAKVVCTSRFGIPQMRKRSILVAVRRDIVRPDRLADLMGKEMLIPEADPDAGIVTVAQAIGHLPPLAAGESHPELPNHRARALSDINTKRITAAKPGESNIYMETTEHGDLTLPCHRRAAEKFDTRCFTDVYTRMHPNRPSPTITTRCHSVSNGRFAHYDVNQVRAISLREAAILQSFPDGYVFYPEDELEPVARMIGNAVPPRLARFFAGYLTGSVVTGRRAG